MIHINIGSNLESIHGSKMDNISIAINLLQEAKVRILEISNFLKIYSKKNLMQTIKSFWELIVLTKIKFIIL